jgi:glycerate dehydrogenase
LTNLVARHAASVHEGEWSRSPDFSYSLGSLIELADLRLGLIGAGRIGMAVAGIGTAFGMHTTCVTSRDDRHALNALLAESDVISLHCPLTPQTRELIRRETLELCKPTALLVNTARGPLIHEQDLADALNAGRLGGAALDVLSQEPPSPDNPLLRARRCLITPHIAWATAAARRRLLAMAVDNLRAFLAGTPQNVVN